MYKVLEIYIFAELIIKTHACKKVKVPPIQEKIHSIAASLVAVIFSAAAFSKLCKLLVEIIDTVVLLLLRSTQDPHPYLLLHRLLLTLFLTLLILRPAQDHMHKFLVRHGAVVQIIIPLAPLKNSFQIPLFSTLFSIESLDCQELFLVAAFSENEPKNAVYLTAVLSVSASISSCNGRKDINCFFCSE